MYLKKSEAPRVVRLADGSWLSRADLPEPRAYWTSARKETVVRAVDAGLITLGEALTHYDLSPEEFDGWREAVRLKGRGGLRAPAQTRVRQNALSRARREVDK